ncbi:MAG TPA: hypothetical protein VN258_11730 [Mobilitalea sp.]|nr:hypothetical protein [Mobilitalea sp.]
MKKGDYLWGLLLLIWIVILVIPVSRTVFFSVTEGHPYLAGFVKFAILATMGDLLGKRVSNKNWIIPKGFLARAAVWGIIGIMITLVFTVYMGGVASAQTAMRLPWKGSIIAQALFGSIIMNLTFGPMMMTFHRFMDMLIDLKYERRGGRVTITELVDKNDWHSLVEFAWLKTCIFFWIPVHTLVFLLPGEYRVLVSAFLSIALGLLLAAANANKNPDNLKMKCAKQN